MDWRAAILQLYRARAGGGRAGVAVRRATGRKPGAQALFHDWRRPLARGLWLAGGGHGAGVGAA